MLAQSVDNGPRADLLRGLCPALEGRDGPRRRNLYLRLSGKLPPKYGPFTLVDGSSLHRQ